MQLQKMINIFYKHHPKKLIGKLPFLDSTSPMEKPTIKLFVKWK